MPNSIGFTSRFKTSFLVVDSSPLVSGNRVVCLCFDSRFAVVFCGLDTPRNTSPIALGVSALTPCKVDHAQRRIRGLKRIRTWFCKLERDERAAV